MFEVLWLSPRPAKAMASVALQVMCIGIPLLCYKFLLLYCCTIYLFWYHQDLADAAYKILAASWCCVRRITGVSCSGKDYCQVDQGCYVVKLKLLTQHISGPVTKYKYKLLYVSNQDRTGAMAWVRARARHVIC